jgi:hypothetical protein
MPTSTLCRLAVALVAAAFVLVSAPPARASAARSRGERSRVRVPVVEVAVYDAISGVPLVGAEVRIDQVVATTNVHGVAVLPLLGAALHKLVVHLDGYAPARRALPHPERGAPPPPRQRIRLLPALEA